MNNDSGAQTLLFPRWAVFFLATVLIIYLAFLFSRPNKNLQILHSTVGQTKKLLSSSDSSQRLSNCTDLGKKSIELYFECDVAEKSAKKILDYLNEYPPSILRIYDHNCCSIEFKGFRAVSETTGRFSPLFLLFTKNRRCVVS